MGLDLSYLLCLFVHSFVVCTSEYTSFKPRLQPFRHLVPTIKLAHTSSTNLTDIQVVTMAPKRHNKKAAPNIKVLAENSEHLLTQRMNWAVDKVKMLKKQKQRALIYLRDSETAR